MLDARRARWTDKQVSVWQLRRRCRCRETWKLTLAQGMPGAESSKTCWKSMRSSHSRACMTGKPSGLLSGPSPAALSASLTPSALVKPAQVARGELAVRSAACVERQPVPVALPCDGSGLAVSALCDCGAVEGVAAGCASALDPGRSTLCAAAAAAARYT